MKSSKSLKGLTQKYRGKPKKFADGGSVRRPAAAPTVRPFDPDYIERLAAQAIGSGEPVTELRSAEGRGFAPMPRSFGEAGQRMSAVIRGDVEPTPEEERQINFVRGFTEGPASIRAYHGSPYAFERFDISKIGTGEGNQTYGRGLYFAENPDVARGYRDTLSKYTTALNQRIGDTNPIDLYSKIEKRAERLPTRSAQIEYDKLSALESLMQHGDVLGVSEAAKAGQITPEAFSWFQKNIEPQLSREGSLYEVRLRTTPEQLLSLDAPIASQPRNIREELKSAGILKAYRENLSDFSSPMQTRNRNARGENIMSFLEHTKGGPEGAALTLTNLGIPGVRYLDEASRAAGRGTRNYVMFGDDLIDITRRYAEGGLADLDQKYADGGRVRRPAAAPLASPFDADYIERLAAQAVGAGEPVAELRSAEGRGFAPMPRSFGEAGERMSAVIRGDVEPTPEEERQINFVRGFTEGPAAVVVRGANVARGLQTTGDFRPVFPQPERLIPEAERVTGGRYLENPRFDPATRQGSGVDITGETRAGARVQIDPSGKAVMLVSPQGAELPTERSQGPLIRANLFRRSAGWDWAGEPPPGARDFPTIVSVKHGKNHYYALGTDFEGPVQMSRYPGDAEPRLKPTAKGDIELGREIGRISVRGKEEHPVYDMIYNIPRYSHGGLAALDEKYAEGGTVRAPKETTISGQEHELAYITPSEAELLKYFGGSGRMTDYGVRAYDEGPGGEGPGGEGPGGQGPGGDPGDNAGSMSDPGTQDAAGGNAGQGAGPTGAGAGPTGEQGPGPTGEDTGGAETSVTAPAPAPTPNTGAFGQFGASLGIGAIAGLAGLGLGVPGLGTVGTAIGTAVDAARANEQLGMMGLDPNISTTQAIANAVSFGMLGQSVTDQFGQALGFDALAEAPMSAFSGPPSDPGPTADTSGGSDYIAQPAGTGTLAPALASLNQQYSEQFGSPYRAWNWSQIQRDAAANNMTLDAYVARNMGNLFANAPRVMKEGGAVTKGKSLEDLHRRYAEGGDVRAPAGEVAEYDPEEIDRIARQIHLRFPEDDMPRTTYDEVESPTDLITRARLLMRGQNVGMPRHVGMGDGNDVMSSSTGLMELPLEDDRYGVTQRMLNTSINAMLDPDRNAGIGLGLSALERPGERGFTGYGPQVSASYGPASVYGGYQSITPNFPGAKSQGSYTYGGNLRIPLDEEGAAANIGANIMAGRRGQMGMGSAGTQITGSLERPFLGGRLGLDVSVDPSLRQREILLGYRRAF